MHGHLLLRRNDDGYAKKTKDWACPLVYHARASTVERTRVLETNETLDVVCRAGLPHRIPVELSIHVSYVNIFACSAPRHGAIVTSIHIPLATRVPYAVGWLRHNSNFEQITSHATICLVKTAVLSLSLMWMNQISDSDPHKRSAFAIISSEAVFSRTLWACFTADILISLMLKKISESVSNVSWYTQRRSQWIDNV